MATDTPLDFQDFIGTTADEQRWQIVSAIQGQTGLAENVNITGPLDGSGNVKVDIANSDTQVSVNINDTTGNALSSSGSGSLKCDLYDSNDNELLGQDARYDATSNGLFAIRTNGTINGNRLTFTAPTSTVTVTSSAIIRSATTSATYLSVSNTGLVNTLYVNPTGGTASATLGIPIAPGGTFVFPVNGIPTTNVTAFSITTTVFVVFG